MIPLILYAAFALLLLAAALRLLAPSGHEVARTLLPAEVPADYFPVHCRYFPQMRQLFSEEDAAFLATRGSPALRRRWKADRKRAARFYLRGLRQDFAGLNRLARALARYSAQLQAWQQAQVVWMNLRFQLLYRVALAHILLGLPAGEELQRVARMVGSLSGRLEKAGLHLASTSGALTP
jgi:hypothetical protein